MYQSKKIIPYSYSEQNSNMIPSFVCFADILGFTQLSFEYIKAGEGERFLSKIRKALTEAYKRVRKHSQGFTGEEFFSIKIFTDNIVVGYPIPNYKKDRSCGELELGDIFRVFAEFQVGLAMEGFLIRGGIAFGNHYMDDEIVFGDALIEALSLDKSGYPPCISLAPSAVDMLQRHIGFYGKTEWSPQYKEVLSDCDGNVFLNYLDEAFLVFPESGIFFDIFEKHRNTIVDGLNRYAASPGIRAKYGWAARYHNYVCQECIQLYSALDENSPDETIAAAEEAKSLTKYLIDIESYAPISKRIDLEPIRPDD